MATVGDRVMVESEKVGRESRVGLVVGVEGQMIRVRWDGGGESVFVPSVGSLRVVGHEGGQPRKSGGTGKSGGARKGGGTRKAAGAGKAGGTRKRSARAS